MKINRYALGEFGAKVAQGVPISLKEKARCNTELYSNLNLPLNNVKPSNFWGHIIADAVDSYVT